jgi:methionine biosynthesis protein MetW
MTYGYEMPQMNSKYSTLEEMLHRIKLQHEPKILDVGCGTGEVTLFIRNKLNLDRIYGVDIDENVLHQAEDKGITVFKVDVSREALPFPDNFFDLCTLLDVIEHLENPDYALKEINRVLRMEGYLILMTPNMAAWYNRLLLLLGMPILGIDLSKEVRYVYPFGVTQVISAHRRLYTLNSLAELLEFHGFRVIDRKGYSQIFSKTQIKGFMHLVEVVDKIFAKKASLAANICLLAVKRQEVKCTQ